jgi:POT family proton-dependent oligopeptide transporter
MAPDDRRFFGHPRGLATLFLTEMWERFSFYGMRGLLILFMAAPVKTGGMGFPLPEAGAIYGLYTGMVYLLSLPGGWIADRILGQRRAVLYGGIVIACGHFCLTIPAVPTFFLGLVLIVIGTGLLKPNISTMVGQLYEKNDPRRDAGFSIFYMGINIGAFIAPLTCSYLGEKVNWHYGFGLAGIGMTLGVIQYAFGQRFLGRAGARPAVDAPAKRQFRISGAIFIVLLAAGAWAAMTGALSIQALSSGFGFLLTAIVVVLFAGLLIFGKWTRVERNRLIAIYILFAAAALFWSIYEQAGSTLNLFAERNTDRSFPWMNGGFPAGWFQALPALFVIMIAPVFAWLWVKLGTRNPSSPAKFALGLLFGGVSFLILIPVAAKTGVSPIWLALVYLLQTIGELCLSPVGMSAMTKLAPPRIASLMMGVFFVSISVGDYISGRLASVYETFPLPKLFGMVGLSALAIGLLLVVFLKPIKRLMGGVN